MKNTSNRFFKKRKQNIIRRSGVVRLFLEKGRKRWKTRGGFWLPVAPNGRILVSRGYMELTYA